MTNSAILGTASPSTLTALAAALMLGFGAARAETTAQTPDEMRKELYSIQSTASIGLGWVSADNRRFGQYRALNQSGPVALLDLDLIQRDAETGTWLKLFGKDLGLANREFRFTHERQGDWAYSLQASQFTRREPLIVNTGLQGAGTANQFVSATAPKRDLDFKIDHDIVTLGARKFVAAGLDVQVSFRQDNSRGERMLGRGTTNVMEFLTEPIDRTTRQWQVLAGYADRSLQLSGGYGGSSYDNHIPVLISTGGNSTASAFGTAWVMAMPPSNAAHQLHLSGGYNLGSSTRSSFKLSRTVALQNQTFDSAFTRLAGAPESLNGKVVTTLGYVDLTMRPMKRLDLTGILRYEDRDDQTPEARYLAEQLPTVGGSYTIAGVTGFNKPRSLQQTKGTLEAGYQLDDGYRISAGLEQEDLKRNFPSKYRRVAFRETTSEGTARLDFKRTMSDVINGGIALLHSQRKGSDYIPDTYDPNALTNQVNALIWADRSRDKLRLSGDWLPDEQWSLTLLAELSQDLYSGRAMGPREGRARFISGDASYRFNDKWTLTGWASHDYTRSTQITRSDRVGSVAAGYDTTWQADLAYTTQAVGLNVTGKPRAATTLALDLSASNHIADTGMAKVGGGGTLPLNALPQYFYRQQTLKFSGEQALQRLSSVRLELVLDHRSNNDWTWTNWVYNGSPAVAAAARSSDGTTVRNLPSESVVFIGISYRQRWN